MRTPRRLPVVPATRAAWTARRSGLRLLRQGDFFRFGRKAAKLGAWLLAAALAAPACAFAADAAVGTGGASFLKLGAGSPRAQALGRAYVALAEGHDSMVWNPAGLARSHSREIGFAYLQYVQDYKGQYAGYVHPLGRSVVGVNMAYMSISDFDARDVNGLPLDNSDVVARHGFATVSFARSFFLERFFLGASLKTIYEDNEGPTRTNMAADVGVLARPSRRWSVGASLQNALAGESNVVQTSRLGAAFSPNDFVTLSVESSADSDSGSHLGMGVEFIFPEELLEVGEFRLRAGYYNRDNLGEGVGGGYKPFGLDLSRAAGVSLGAGLFTNYLPGYGVGVDYAYVPMGSLGVVHQFAVRVSF